MVGFVESCCPSWLLIYDLLELHLNVRVHRLQLVFELLFVWVWLVDLVRALVPKLGAGVVEVVALPGIGHAVVETEPGPLPHLVELPDPRAQVCLDGLTPIRVERVEAV